jgi:aryl-alcohol dehydrogenase-like predicted oxidoreductase
LEYRHLGKTGFDVSAVGFGAWGIGSEWGPVDDETSLKALHAAADAGINFFDTADVYGSEPLLGRFLRERDERLYVATKLGRKAAPSFDREQFGERQLEAWVDESRENLGVDTLDLLQLHTLPADFYYWPELFQHLDRLVENGKVAHVGVSVERSEEGLKAIEYDGVASVQIIFNMLRHRPAERFFSAAAERDVGIVVRVPLASGILTGKLSADSAFAPDDHRRFNVRGEAFDVGETFSGVPLEVGVEFADAIRPLVPEGAAMAQLALRWILMWPEVSTVIPGAKTPEQARANAAAADLPPVPEQTMRRVEELYRERIAPLVHQRW